MALAGLPATVAVADVIPYRTQEALVQSFVPLYQANFFISFQFDLINSPPFTCFGCWLRDQLSWDGSLGPVHSTPHQHLRSASRGSLEESRVAPLALFWFKRVASVGQ